MNPLLEQFLLEAREFLQGIAEKLLALEGEPGSEVLMTELFRFVHTLKGNSGLFEFPELTRVLHAAEDLMDGVRDQRVAYSRGLADQLLESMDFVGLLLDEIEASGGIAPRHAAASSALAKALRALLPEKDGGADAAGRAGGPGTPTGAASAAATVRDTNALDAAALAAMPESARTAAAARQRAGTPVFWVEYIPEESCFFKGEDPFFLVRQTPGLLWGNVVAREVWPPLLELDCYRCAVTFQALVAVERSELDQHFRYVPEQVRIVPNPLLSPAVPEPAPTSPPSARGRARSGSRARAILAFQAAVLDLPDQGDWLGGRLRAAAAAIRGCVTATGGSCVDLDRALQDALRQGTAKPLAAWLAAWREAETAAAAEATPGATVPAAAEPAPGAEPGLAGGEAGASASPEGESRFGRRAEDQPSAKVLKVDHAKIDRLMNLIGEMVVAKNGLPYLASRAEEQYGVRDLAREIKAQYAVINRIAEEMQDAIMQVRTLPVSFVFQRFPRLVRDLSRKLGKEVELVLEGGETEADKSIVEALADPLIHIVRNSLDHGLETPEVRAAAGKSGTGRLTIRAAQESDRVAIEIVDDGRGIDPAVIRRKAYEKGLIDEAALERLNDQEAINLVFASGFSTADAVSDLSGRGVGMDVVRSAIAKVGGTVELSSEVGRGTRLRLTLPLSMAVTNVMIVESDRQIFGVPMSLVVETVRLPRARIRTLKRQRTTVLRDKVVPLLALNDLLAVKREPLANADDELATLVVRGGSGQVGLLVDDFREVADVVLKPLPGELAKLACYAGTALLGDGSVLMVLDPREMM